MSVGLEQLVPAASYLEEAFLRWVLTPAADAAIVQRVHSQYPVTVQERTYRLDYRGFPPERGHLGHWTLRVQRKRCHRW
ncbi:hypothetical protein ACVW19_006852 [Streptomyces sp. TE5632]